MILPNFYGMNGMDETLVTERCDVAARAIALLARFPRCKPEACQPISRGSSVPAERDATTPGRHDNNAPTPAGVAEKMGSALRAPSPGGRRLPLEAI
jgi:hypothetical protein